MLRVLTQSTKVAQKVNSQYKQLALKKRYQIEGLNELGFSARGVIATKMERSNKTIASEYCAKVALTHAARIRA